MAIDHHWLPACVERVREERAKGACTILSSKDGTSRPADYVPGLRQIEIDGRVYMTNVGGRAEMRWYDVIHLSHLVLHTWTLNHVEVSL